MGLPKSGLLGAEGVLSFGSLQMAVLLLKKWNRVRRLGEAGFRVILADKGIFYRVKQDWADPESRWQEFKMPKEFPRGGLNRLRKNSSGRLGASGHDRGTGGPSGSGSRADKANRMSGFSPRWMLPGFLNPEQPFFRSL